MENQNQKQNEEDNKHPSMRTMTDEEMVMYESTLYTGIAMLKTQQFFKEHSNKSSNQFVRDMFPVAQKIDSRIRHDAVVRCVMYLRSMGIVIPPEEVEKMKAASISFRQVKDEKTGNVSGNTQSLS